MGEYLKICAAVLRHGIGTVLAHTDAVTVAGDGKRDVSVLKGQVEFCAAKVEHGTDFCAGYRYGTDDDAFDVTAVGEGGG